MPTLIRSSLVVFALLVAVSGCRAGRSAKKSRPIAAHVGDQAIYVDEVDKVIAADLFDLRSGVIHKMIANALLQAEARKRGVDLPELWRIEVEGKVPTADGNAAAKIVDEWVSAGKLKATEASQLSPESASLRVREFRTMEREQAYFDALYAKAGVQVDFAALGKPWLQIANDGPTIGPKDAPITIVEFADLTKSFTSMWEPTLEKLVGKYGGKVRFVFKQKPDGGESPSAKVAEATLCANDQQRYWEFRKALFADGKPIVPESVTAAATASKLDVARFQECLSSGRNKENVARNIQEAVANRLEGEPVLSLNGIRLTGAQPFAEVERLLQNELSTL